MSKLWFPLVIAVSLSTAACDGPLTSTRTAAVTSDGGVDAPVDAPPPGYIDTVLACGATGTGGLTGGTDLQRVDLDLGVFPDARCNDRSNGVFYFRPAATPAGRTRWLIELEGGGGCVTPDACANRWCGYGTRLGEDQMSTTAAPGPGIEMGGIFYRGPVRANPFADFNQVFIVYCSSDTWTGRTGPIVVDATYPGSSPPTPVQFQIDFHGQDILDATLATLRRAGVPAPVYTLGGGAVTLPDLDDASYVMLAGASAGGGGVIHNVDRVRALLAATNTTSSFEVNALIDSTFGPNANSLDWSASRSCGQLPGCTGWQDILAAGTSMYPRNGDTSCETWHAFYDPLDAWLCKDGGHVIRNHVTTPMMIRQGLRDQLLSDNLITEGVTSPVPPPGGAMTLGMFEDLVRMDLLALANIRTTAEESAAIGTVPATFGPPCPDHDTLESNAPVFDADVEQAGVPYTMFDVLANWRSGGVTGPTQVVWAAPDPFNCP